MGNRFIVARSEDQTTSSDCHSFGSADNVRRPLMFSHQSWRHRRKMDGGTIPSMGTFSSSGHDYAEVASRLTPFSVLTATRTAEDRWILSWQSIPLKIQGSQSWSSVLRTVVSTSREEHALPFLSTGLIYQKSQLFFTQFLVATCFIWLPIRG